jgi:hypothetical protein
LLDDDMTPGEGLVTRHRSAHTDGGEQLVMGPCLFARGANVTRFNREWADEWYSLLEREGIVRTAEHGSYANTSGPRAVFEQLGGFDERFVGWGGEDFEMTVRALAAGVTIRFDPKAIAWHHQRRGVIDMCAKTVDRGRNAVRICRIHPEVTDDLFPPHSPLGHRARLRRIGAQNPVIARTVARVAAVAAAAEQATPLAERARFLSLAVEASLLAGVSEVDEQGDLVARLLRDP